MADDDSVVDVQPGCEVKRRAATNSVKQWATRLAVFAGIPHLHDREEARIWRRRTSNRHAPPVPVPLLGTAMSMQAVLLYFEYAIANQ
ncbi:MAG: hypothetical protein K6T59_14330 [Bryobacteraceae bacterium]|nr:hypothetical protein [Bryobacteraceae bacterium]